MAASKCKFCGVTEGSTGRNCQPVHINRDKLCAPCATLLNKVNYQPEKLSDYDKKFYGQQCMINTRKGAFVPRIYKQARLSK